MIVQRGSKPPSSPARPTPLNRIGLSRRSTFALGVGMALSQAASTSKADTTTGVQGEDFHQVPGIIRWKIGAVEVTAVSDGVSTLPLDVVPKADPIVAKELADAAFLSPGDAIPIAINTYPLRGVDRLGLVDTGGGRFFGPQAGVLKHNLKAAGVTPDMIDVLILTHLHPDHVAGMTTDDGRAVFPHATLVVHEAELA